MTSRHPPVSITDLPYPAIERVVQLCDTGEILAMRATCTMLRDMVHETVTRLRRIGHFATGRFLEKFPRLTDIGFARTRNSIPYLLRNYTNLKTLCLDGDARRLDGDETRPLSRMHHLTSLGLREWIIKDDSSMGHLSMMTNLTDLDLNTSQITSGNGIRAMAGLTNLTRLNLLRVNEVSEYGYTKVLVYATRGMSKLKTLNLNMHLETLTDDDILDLAVHWTSLTDLDLDIPISQGITDIALKALARLTTLTRLRLPPSPMVTDEGLKALAQCIELKDISLSECHLVTDTGVKALASMTNLTSLDADYTARFTNHDLNITDVALKELARLPRLTFLRLPPSPMVTDEGIKALMKCVNLKEISLMIECEMITDEVVIALDKCTNLKRMSLSLDFHNWDSSCYGARDDRFFLEGDSWYTRCNGESLENYYASTYPWYSYKNWVPID